VDHEVDVLCEFDPNGLKQVACGVRANGEHLRWVGVGLEIDDGKSMTECVDNGGFVHLVVVSRGVYLHTPYIVIRYSSRVKPSDDQLLDATAEAGRLDPGDKFPASR